MEPNKWAILIGVNYYISGTARPEIDYHSLNGCVEDVRQIEELLRTSFGMDDPYIRRLTATAPSNGQQEPKEPPSERPTYENIISAFKEVIQQAKPNDLVYIHYSGHGTRVQTIFGDWKHNNLDEALVPTDILCNDGRYVRDVEIAYLLEEMVEKNLIVTLVLDCCHSGGANRGRKNELVRGIEKVDLNVLEHDLSVLSSREELRAAWEKNTANVKRMARVQRHWLLETHGYTFLAACRINEYAMEGTFDGKTQGLLTYALVNTIKNHSINLTYYRLCALIATKVRKHNDQQTVILGGEAHRLFFSSDSRDPFCLIPIKEVIQRGSETLVHLDIGSAQGIATSTRIDVWPPSCSEFTPSKRCALLQVVDVDEFKLRAKVVEWFTDSERQLEPGFLGRPHAVPRMAVHLADSESHQDLLAKIREVFKEYKIPLSSDSAKASFRVCIDDGNYMILNGNGQHLQNTVPPLSLRIEDAEERLARRIAHLTVYYNILNLTNIEISSSDDCISALIGKKPPDFPGLARKRNNPPNISGLSSDFCEAGDGEWLLLRVKNNSENEKYIMIMDLESSWQVEQIYPNRPGINFEMLEAGQELDFPIQVTLPDCAVPGQTIDILKIIATDEPTSFRCLELPGLNDHDQGESVRGNNPRPRNALEALQEALLPRSRKVTSSLYVPTGWSTAHVAIKMSRNETAERDTMVVDV